MASGSRMKTIDGKYYVTNEDVNKILSGQQMSGIIKGTISGAISGQLNEISKAGSAISGQINEHTTQISGLIEEDVKINQKINNVENLISWETLD